MTEFWVMRVVLHRGHHAALQTDLLSGVAATGEVCSVNASDGFVLLPDAAIAEPIEVFDDEHAAHLHREIMRAKHPGEDFRVILNSDGTK
jgi:hypothetical protein